MADRLLVDLDRDGQVTVGLWPQGGLPETLSRSRLVWPLDGGALEDVRWYLEDYLLAPFGVWEDRGPRIQAQMARWGQEVFASVFGSGTARDAYQRTRDRELELVFRSADPGLLGLPWELMRDPAGPVALNLAGVSRALPVADLAQTAGVPGGNLRVLMVISRPAGTRDIEYRMIARPLLERLEAVRGQVELVVLRPPTLEALRDVLAKAVAAGKPFQMVHFDGHGALPSRPAAEGVLGFEKPGGGADQVAVSKVAAVLKEAGVPVVVLNACQSGAVGKDLEAAVATRLLREGCAAVVAMAYSVYAVAAAEFMAIFYEHLFAGDTVSAAVTAGRRRLFEKDRRPSPKGELPLADWLVPVHYMRRDVAFPQARINRPQGEPSLEAMLDNLRIPSVRRDGGPESLDPVGEFVGRDDLFFELEAAARLQNVVVLHGQGGIGKTELAKAFGRWWRDTGGVEMPEWVLWHSFEPGVASFGLDGVITETGLAVFGTDFARLGPEERHQVVEGLLAERRLLLIWDNFETVHTMPDPAGVTAPLDDNERTKIKGFLARLVTQGRSAVIITSRTAEEWLGPVRRIEVGRLAAEEVAEYAGDLLAPYPAAMPRRDQRTFGDLLEWLEGHPLSMRMILPRLDTTDPQVLLEGLLGITPLPGDEDGEDRAASLAASITYSFIHLTTETWRLLPVVGLFHGVVDAEVLGIFSQAKGCPARFVGTSKREWEQVLVDAARVGLLTSLGAGMWQVHPALPGYLAAQWRADEPEGHDEARASATGALVTAYAELGARLGRQMGTEDAAFAYKVTGLQRRTLGVMLGYALDHQMWKQAQAIVWPLDRYWNARGQLEEAVAWADRIQIATENPDGRPPSPDSPAGSLWLFVAGQQADRHVRAGRLNQAERTYRNILAMLDAEPLTPETVTGRLTNVSAACLQLGVVAQERGRLDEAENWYRASLAIDEDLGDRPGMASNYHQLGNVAYLRGRFREAGDWYRKSLPLYRSLGDRPHMAADYHQLGNVAREQGLLGEAENWYRKSVAINEELGDRPGMAKTRHELGIVAQERGLLGEAENWYRKSLAINEELGDRPGMALTYGQLGLLAEQRGELGQALEWTVRCVTLFEQFPHPSTGPAPRHLARLTSHLGTGSLERRWQEATGGPLPKIVRDYVTSHWADPGEQER